MAYKVNVVIETDDEGYYAYAPERKRRLSKEILTTSLEVSIA